MSWLQGGLLALLAGILIAAFTVYDGVAGVLILAGLVVALVGLILRR